MAIELTERYRLASISGNKIIAGFSAVLTGNYPASGGYAVANAQMPSAVQIFNKIYDVICHDDLADDYRYDIDFSSLDNSDATDPTFEIDAYMPDTGGGYGELSAGLAHANTIYFQVIGVPVGGQDSSRI